jgi:hypothetical protein
LRFGGNKVELTQWSREEPKEKPAKGSFVATTKDMDDTSMPLLKA